MRPNFLFLSAKSNAILKPGGLLKWKKRLVKDERFLLPLIEMIKVVRPTSLLTDLPHLLLPKPRLRHRRRLAVLSFQHLILNLCILSFVQSLALLPHLPPLPTSLIVLLPGSRLRLFPTSWDPTFLFFSQKPCVAKPEATFLSSTEPRGLRGLIRFSAPSSPPLNFSRLPQTSLSTAIGPDKVSPSW